MASTFDNGGAKKPSLRLAWGGGGGVQGNPVWPMD